MRPVDEIRRRWTLLFDGSLGLDLRQAVRDDEGFDPCEGGLRSVCWKAFLLYGPPSQVSWTKKIAESRAGYTSLRDHFLRFIENPDDIHSTTDPLADDDNSPWSTLRQDELNREEIFQDVTRCMQDNYFFREPTTQKRLLDVLFIYSKLNPDIGYRQGMHELLAPILWVVHQDAIDSKSITEKERNQEGMSLMVDVLDHRYIEHDSFSLFCAVMQTVKVFYEPGSSSDSSPIILRSRRIHEELLDAVDPELAIHLRVVGVLPQIYLIRWLRLLFGREFDFSDTLRIWDMLFAEKTRSDLIDFTCVALLLRIRWLLIDADYTTAITKLTHCDLPASSGTPKSLVKDALILESNRNKLTGARIVQQHSGRTLAVSPTTSPPRSLQPFQQTKPMRTPHSRTSASPSPARFGSPQRQLGSLLSEVSTGLQRRTEGWNVSNAVRGAVGEVSRNVANLTATHSRQASEDLSRIKSDKTSASRTSLPDSSVQDFENRLQKLQERNKALAKMLDEALDSLRVGKAKGEERPEQLDDFNMSLAKIQFVSVFLADSSIPLPLQQSEEPSEEPTIPAVVSSEVVNPTSTASIRKTSQTETVVPPPEIVTSGSEEKAKNVIPSTAPKKHATRPSLNDASFSFMLGENRHRSSFVSSVTPAPEHRRGSDASTDPKPLWKEGKEKSRPKPKNSQPEPDDEFTLASWK